MPPPTLPVDSAPAAAPAAGPNSAAAPATLALPAAAGPVPPVPSRVVRAVLACTRVAPGDRVAVAGPAADDLAALLDHLGLCVEDATAANAAVACEAAVWCGPGELADPEDLRALAARVRPGRQAVALRRCEDLAADDAGGVRFADRGRFGFPAGRGGWAMRTAPGRAVRGRVRQQRTGPAGRGGVGVRDQTRGGENRGGGETSGRRR